MGKSLARTILERHLAVGEWVPGAEIGIRIDQTLTQDATGTMAYLQFEAMGLERVRTDLSVSYVDHNTIQVGFENADDHRYLQSVAAKYGVIFSKAGNGICHQVHLERFGKPGATLLGSDSHTPTGGGLGMIAIGAGGLDVAVAMGGGEFYLTCPRVYKINLTGRLQPWVSAKDVVLAMLEIFGVKGNVGVVLEYGGPGVKTLTVPERATITNMGAEMGVTTSLFPSDAETRRFLRAQGREADWTELKADRDAAYSGDAEYNEDADYSGDAEYDRVVDLDLSAVEPLAAAPHSPGNVVKVADLKGMKVDQVLLGSCTNSSYKDVATAARIVRGRTVHPDVSFGVAPGSRQVLQMATRDGYVADLIAAGARLLESACGFCIGNSQSPQTGAVSLRTSNRNFEGRSGTKDAQIYLVSPEVAVLAALAGEIVDPREAGIEYPAVKMPAHFLVDDTMLVFPGDAQPGEVHRGPNIGTPPVNESLPDTIAGVVQLKVGDNITTDHIMPAGARLKYRSNVPTYSEYVFEPVDPGFAARARADKERGRHTVVVAGESYGQGSSREHAALCPMYLGVKAIVTKSIERIHAANLVNFGILPLTFADPADYDRVEQGDEFEIRGIRAAFEAGTPLVLIDTTKGIEIALSYNLSRRQKDIIYAGGLLAYTVGDHS
jgi:aconitate hydratase